MPKLIAPLKWRQRQWTAFPLELLFWISSLLVLAVLSPEQMGGFSLCLFKRLGISFCPGCGLGRSIAWLFRGELMASFLTHPLGIPAVLIIGQRIFILAKTYVQASGHRAQALRT